MEFGTTTKSFGTWIDLFRCHVYLVALDYESLASAVNVTVAINDGTGNPLAGTAVTKLVNFSATSSGPS